MAKKLKLISNSDSDFYLIGIASHLKDYRLIWSLNEQLGLGYTKMADLKAFNDKLGEILTYPLYYFDQTDAFKTWYFIGNYNEKAFLIPEQKQTHFFILVKGNYTPENMTLYMQEIKKIKNILAVYPIPLNTVKNMEFVLSDLEIHMMEIARER